MRKKVSRFFKKQTKRNYKESEMSNHRQEMKEEESLTRHAAMKMVSERTLESSLTNDRKKRGSVMDT